MKPINAINVLISNCMVSMKQFKELLSICFSDKFYYSSKLLRMNKFLIIIVFSNSLTSCTLLHPVALPQIHKYQITGSSSNVTEVCDSKSASNDTLQIQSMEANPPYDTYYMYYSSSKFELEKYVYHQWIAQPKKMLAQVIDQKMLQSCLYKNIVSSDFVTTSDKRLFTQLLQFKQQIIDDKRSLVLLNVLAQLVDNKSGTVIKSKIFVKSIPEAASPDGFVDGANLATEQFLNELVVWLKNK